MELTLSKGYKMASVVTLTAVGLIVLNGQAVLEAGLEPLPVLSLASSVLVLLLGLRLLLDRPETDD